MRLGYLSVPLAVILFVPLICQGVSGADISGFGVYDVGSSPETEHEGPILSGTVDFTLTDDVKLVLPKGTLLSEPVAYMRLNSDEEVQYRVSVDVGGMKGFALECGLTFEFCSDKGCDECVSSVTLYQDGTAYSGLSFVSDRDYYIAVVSSKEIVLASIPDSITGMSIRIGVTIGDDGLTVIEDRTGDIVVDLGDGRCRIDADDLPGMVDRNGGMTLLLGNCRISLDKVAVDGIVSGTEEDLEIYIEEIDSEGSAPDRKMFEIHLISDGERIASLGGGTITVTVPYDSGSRFNEVKVKSIDQNGRTADCDSSYDYDSGTLVFSSGSPYIFSVESSARPVNNDVRNESNGTGMILAIPIAIIIAMILLPIVLKWKGKI